MKRRRPTTRDRDIAQYILNKLPVGNHLILVELEDGGAYLKAEGGTTIWHENKRISIIPNVKRP